AGLGPAKVGAGPAGGERQPAEDPATVRAPAGPVAAGRGAGADPAGLVLREAAHPRGERAEPGRAARRPDGPAPRAAAGPGGPGPALPLPLRDRPGDGQP